MRTQPPEDGCNQLVAPPDTSENRAGSPRELVETLRAVRQQGNEALTAVEEYDPDFSVKLSACTDPMNATVLLDDWLTRRLTVLRATKDRLLTAWERDVDRYRPSESH